MRLELQRNVREPETLSIYGRLSSPEDAGIGLMTCEREWKDNAPGVSCVPAGFYVLEPHDGAKYNNTFALIGHLVGHSPGPGIIRTACVLHKSTTGRGLQGCVAWARSLTASGLWGFEDGTEVLQLLRDTPGPHYLTIIDDFG